MTPNHKTGLAAVVLAAGSASRMGALKQLLPWKGATLLEHVMNTLEGLQLNRRLLVLGAQAEAITTRIDHGAWELLNNPNWAYGMGTSIAHAVQALCSDAEIRGILIVLADQPLVTAHHLEALSETYFNGGCKAVVSQYPNGKKGVPAIFDRSVFTELQSLSGDAGARNIIEQMQEGVCAANASRLLVDIDTPEAYKTMYELHHKYKG